MQALLKRKESLKKQKEEESKLALPEVCHSGLNRLSLLVSNKNLFFLATAIMTLSSEAKLYATY